MHGSDEQSGSLFSYVDLEARIRSDHPIKPTSTRCQSAWRPRGARGYHAGFY